MTLEAKGGTMDNLFLRDRMEELNYHLYLTTGEYCVTPTHHGIPVALPLYDNSITENSKHFSNENAGIRKKVN